MASAARQSRPSGKKAPEPRRAWTGARASPTFSPVNTPRPTNPPNPAPSQSAFPPLTTTQANGSRPEGLLQALAGLTGTTITLRTKTGQHFEGVVFSTGGEGDTTGITLRDVREISTPGQPIKPTLFIASTNIGSWNSGPADAKAPNGDTFRTDTDISQKAAPRANRELQAWQPSNDAPTADGAIASKGGDEETFGAGSANGTSWDQFAANEQLFGITPQFDENVYTTKLDRNAVDFKERERKAQRIANEITGTATNNPHLAEERGQTVDESGVDEENKYGAVVRSSNAYVPPGARKTNPAGNAGKATSPPPATSSKGDVPKVSVNAPDGAVVQPAAPSSSKTPSPAPAPGATKPPADALPAFRDFVTNERQRLTQKKQALVKSEMDKRMAELVKFSQNFKLNKPIPDDLVPILAKDEQKQQAIREKSTKDATSSQARTIGASISSSAVAARSPAAAKPVAADPSRKAPTAQVVKPSAPSTTAAPAAPAVKPAAKPDATTKKPVMLIQAIPPFKGAKSRQSTAEQAKTSASSSSSNVATNGTKAAVPSAASAANAAAAAAAANRLNVNASSFRPNPKANAFNPTGPSPPVNGSSSSSASPKPKPETATPNPFFGTRPIKKGTPVHVKDDFNPFKHNKVTKAADVNGLWPYSGKRYMLLYPSPPHQPQQHSPHMAPPQPPPMPPPSYEEDSAAQAAARGYTYVYPPYAYPGQPMMPGMAPPGPPGGYIPAQFMQAIPYPHGMPPPGAMYSPAMGQMPPQGYMPPPPPPGAYAQPPNGAGRPSMPPTPIPPHAHPYYPQSPQMQHTMPYPMMMPPPPPPGSVPQHPYEGGPAQPVQMGGHA